MSARQLIHSCWCPGWYYWYVTDVILVHCSDSFWVNGVIWVHGVAVNVRRKKHTYRGGTRRRGFALLSLQCSSWYEACSLSLCTVTTKWQRLQALKRKLNCWHVWNNKTAWDIWYSYKKAVLINTAFDSFEKKEEEKVSYLIWALVRELILVFLTCRWLSHKHGSMLLQYYFWPTSELHSNYRALLPVSYCEII